jgi:hypothetical protein
MVHWRGAIFHEVKCRGPLLGRGFLRGENGGFTGRPESPGGRTTGDRRSEWGFTLAGSKLIEVHLRCGKVERVGSEFGIGRKE